MTNMFTQALTSTTQVRNVNVIVARAGDTSVRSEALRAPREVGVLAQNVIATQRARIVLIIVINA